MLDRITNIQSTVGMIGAVIGLLILSLALSFVVFTFGYWLITLILFNFFAFTLPFSWTYSLGAWLITLIIGSFMAPSLFISINSKSNRRHH